MTEKTGIDGHRRSEARRKMKFRGAPDPPVPSAGREPINWDRLILGMKKTTKEFIENVLENIIESIVITNLEGYLVFFNKYSEQMFGFEASEVLNRHIAVLGAREPDVLGCIRRNETYNGEIMFRTKGGRRFPAHVRCVPLRGEQDEPIAMVGVARDLTKEKEKQRIDQEMVRLKAFNENLIASLNDGIQIIDLSGRITFVNKRLADLLEYEPGDLLGRHYTTVVDAEDHSLFEHLTASRGEKAGQSSFETSFITKSGKKVPFFVSSSYLREGGDIVSGIVNAVTDISEIQRLKEELFQSEKMSLIGTLASEVAHEINNPLGGLIISVQMLLEDIRDGRLDLEMALEELEEMENDARRCKKITQKLLDFSRSIPEERKPLSITRVIDDSLMLVQRQAEIENIEIVKQYRENLPFVKGNSNSLQQVVMNVVKNARDALVQGGRITISAEPHRFPKEARNWIRLSVADNGPGIPSDLMHRVFKPFFTTKQDGKGTGLGLAVSKRIVEEHGGRMMVENAPGGEGSVFRILLPALEAGGEGGVR
ncbi:PAS domain-containing protein [Desulfatiglans anilini]|uniref:PAS domain-containing protein n=1 Tax=Desulfatiglans anilini TaxID=90728 RepID=UPI00041281B6|nr:PAS domain-containing protein [Desulfatiglans anilini]